jgi:eukaryotic-like serine/threonine-protein kinase
MNPARWERIQEIFLAAAEIDPAIRPGFLASACCDDAALRHEVEDYLGSLDDDCDVVANAIRLEAIKVLDSDHEPVADREVGPYRLVRRIGYGGMGAVYLAARADNEYERQVAIKLVRSDPAANPELIRRFRMERQILASLDHPNIASMLDGGITLKGKPYLVMEYVDGVRIDEYCRSHALSVRQKIELFRTVCSAVAFAHRNLIVHRDIKPSNILVTPRGVPKLLDFGIAKLLRPGSTSETAGLTRPDERLMTPEYASPEQIRGEAVTTATDIYALGIVLYELLASEHPFDAQKSDSAALLRAVCETEARQPSTVIARSAAGIAGLLRGDLDRIVLMAIRKEPESRYSSVEQFSEDLGRYLDGFPVIASRGTRRYRTRKFMRRHRLGVGLAATLVVLLAAFGFGMSVLAARVTRERDSARVERARAEKVSGFLTGLFGSSDPFHRTGDGPSARQLLDDGSMRVSNELRTQPEVRASLLDTMAQAYEHLGVYDRAEDLFREEIQATDQAYGRGSLAASRPLRELADVERRRSKLQAAETHLRQALAIQDKLPQDKDVELSHTLNNLALVLQIKGDLGEAEQYLRRAIAVSRKYPDQATETLTMTSNLGGVLADRGRLDEAEHILRDVLQQRRRILGEQHPQVSTSMGRLGHALLVRGRYGEAERLYRESLRRNRTALGDSHLDTLNTMSSLADVLQEEGSLPESESLYRQAIETGTRALGEHADMAGWYAGLGWVLFSEGRAAEADLDFQRGVAICRSRIGAGSVREARILGRYAVLQTGTARYAEAQRNLEGALAIDRERLGAASAESAETQFRLAENAKARSSVSEAANLYQAALGIDRSATPPLPLQTAAHLIGFAAFLNSANAPSAAEPLAREAVNLLSRNLPADFWTIARARGVLGEALAELHRFPEAEPLLVDSYGALRNRLGEYARDTAAARNRVADLYDAWGNPSRARSYRLSAGE